MNLIPAAVLTVIATICAILALLCGVTFRGILYFISNESSINLSDSHSKLCGVIAGFLFALFFVAFIFKPHRKED